MEEKSTKSQRMKLTELELDTLREIIAIGAGHSSTALSKMLNTKIEVSFPSVSSRPIEEIPSLIGHSEKSVVTIYLSIEGTRKDKKFPVGSLLSILPEKSAITLAHLLQAKEGDKLTELDKDTLKEIGNILAGACLNVLSQFLDFKMIESLPALAHDMLGATMNTILAGLASMVQDALVFKTSFSVETHKVDSHVLLLLDPSVYGLVFEKIREIQNV